MDSLLNRRGRFGISMPLIKANPDAVTKVMAKVIILRAEYMAFKDVIEYEAISPDFPEVNEGDVIPRYTFESDEAGDIRAIRLP